MFCRVIVMCLLVIGSGVAAMAADPPTPANILLIITDDQGYGDAGSYGARDVRTPHMDGIAQCGVRFTAFRVNPLCAPTRASVLSGLHSLEAGMWRGPSQKEDNDRELRADVKLLPQYLKERGYATGLFGKWHLGYQSPDLPNERGFDEFVGFLGGAHPYQLGRNSRIVRNGEPVESEKHLTDLIADEAEAFIKRSVEAEKKFFCYVAFNAVHGPLRSADREADSGKPDWLERYEKLGLAQPRRDYAAILSHADARIGDLLTLLKKVGVERSTLVIWVSDNGALEDKFPGNNGPLRGQKGQTYEGGIRVPAAMCWPGVIPARIVSDAPAAHFDIFATALAAAGVDVPQRNGAHRVGGVNLLPHLKSGGKTPLAERELYWDLYGKMGAARGDWKIVAEMENHHGKFDAAIPVIEQTRFELYNLADDLGETRDLSDAHPDIAADMKRRYVEWFRAATRP